jgi:hypothetical protein
VVEDSLVERQMLTSELELMRKADTAMYQSKMKGGSTYTCYAQ